MTAEEYLTLASESEALASRAAEPEIQGAYRQIAAQWRRLAEMSRANLPGPPPALHAGLPPNA